MFLVSECVNIIIGDTTINRQHSQTLAKLNPNFFKLFSSDWAYVEDFYLRWLDLSFEYL